MKYLLDTDHLSILQSPPSLERAMLMYRMRVASTRSVFAASVSYHEQFAGFQNVLTKSNSDAALRLA